MVNNSAFNAIYETKLIEYPANDLTAHRIYFSVYFLDENSRRRLTDKAWNGYIREVLPIKGLKGY